MNLRSSSSSSVFVESVRLRERLLSVPWDEPEDTGGVSSFFGRRNRQKNKDLRPYLQVIKTFSHIDATSHGTLQWND
jgi:hypothetical protein